MHERKKTALETLKEKLTVEQDTLANEVLPDRDIGEAGQRDEQVGDGEDPDPLTKPKAQKAKNDSVEEVDPSAPRKREIKVRIPMPRRSQSED